MTAHYAVNCQAEQTGLIPAGLGVLAVIHDDIDPGDKFFGTKPFDAAGIKRVHNRLMSPRSGYFSGLEQGAHMVCGNEIDNDWSTWIIPYYQQVRAQRPDLKLHHPAPNTEGQYPYDPAIAAVCDVIDQHVGIGYDGSGNVVFFPWPTPVMFGKPVWITEVEVDQNYPELMSQIPACMEHFADAGYQMVCAWGWNGSTPDVLFHPDVLAAIQALSQPQGGTPVAIDPSIQQVLDQNALIADALYDLTKVLDAIVATDPADGPARSPIQDAKTKVNALNPAKFTFQ